MVISLANLTISAMHFDIMKASYLYIISVNGKPIVFKFSMDSEVLVSSLSVLYSFKFLCKILPFL